MKTLDMRLRNQVCSLQAPATVQHGNECPPTLRPRLYPVFVCWLMGMPWYWTHPEPINSVRRQRRRGAYGWTCICHACSKGRNNLSRQGGCRYPPVAWGMVTHKGG